MDEVETGRAGGRLRTTPALWRLVRRLSNGRFRIDKAASASEAKLDGKWLLRTSDDSLTPTDLALAYKQLLEEERGWRDMKGSLGLRPAFHHREDRIRSHVQLCWLGLLLIRVSENATGGTWRNVRNELDRMHLVTMETAEGRVAQRTSTTPAQAKVRSSLDIAEPGRFLDFTLPTPSAQSLLIGSCSSTRGWLDRARTSSTPVNRHFRGCLVPSICEGPEGGTPTNERRPPSGGPRCPYGQGVWPTQGQWHDPRPPWHCANPGKWAH